MAKQDYGIIISQPGVAVTGASNSQITFNTANAFIKIDTQNKVGFQTIQLIITTDPPNPSGAGAINYTTLYKFKHGYSYIPSVEMLFNVTSFPPATTAGQAYFQDTGTLGQGANLQNAVLYCVTDATWVYIVVKKQNSFFNDTILLTGTNVLISAHVFVDDIGV